MKSALLVLLAVVLLQCFLAVESHRLRLYGRGRGRGRGGRGRPRFLAGRVGGGPTGRGLQAWRQRLAPPSGPRGGISTEESQATPRPRPRPSAVHRQGPQWLTGRAMTGLLGLSGQRQRFPGFPAGARDGEASGGLWGFVPEGALQAAWTRTLAGRQVAESGWCWNNTHVAVAVVRSRDPQLRDVNLTPAVTLYIFRQNDTMVAVRPGFRRLGAPCFLLPPDVVSFSQTQDTLSARNNTVVDVPSRVLRVKVKDTAGGLSPQQRADLFRDNPALLFFCGLGALVPVSVADDGTFPASGQTDTGRVLKMVTMDTEVNILVARRRDKEGFPGNRGLAVARRAGDWVNQVTQAFQGLAGHNTV